MSEKVYAPLQGLAAFLRASASGVAGASEQTLRQWASEVEAADALRTQAQPVVDAEFLANVISLCTSKGASPKSIEGFDPEDKWIADLWRKAAALAAQAPQPAITPEPGSPATVQGAAITSESAAPQPGYVLVRLTPDQIKIGSDVYWGKPQLRNAFEAGARFAENHHSRALAAAPKAPQQKAQEPAYREACTLATALFKKHYAHLIEYASGRVVWGLCDSTAGVISQIDNMVATLVQPAPGGDAWKDGNTAALVNALRDVAVQYRDTQQLRERIAHIVRPLVGHVQNQPKNEHIAGDVSKKLSKLNMTGDWGAARKEGNTP